MTRDILENMIKGKENVAVFLDTTSSHGGYSSGQTYILTKVEEINFCTSFVEFKNVKNPFDMATLKFKSIMVPYELIIAVAEL